jgi:hypothetical protein
MTRKLLQSLRLFMSSPGFMPVDFYDLNTSYGSVEELRRLIAALHSRRVHALATLVINRLAGAATDSTLSWKRAEGTVADVRKHTNSQLSFNTRSVYVQVFWPPHVPDAGGFSSR